MCSEQSDYASYLLRLVRSDRDGRAWRASLESTADRQRIEFSNLKALIGFLNDRYGQTDESVSSSVQRR
jgi:hypothetical protein